MLNWPVSDWTGLDWTVGLNYMAQQAEKSRHRRPLVQCCPLSSNYFAYSSGVKESGVEQHRICRSLQTDDAEQLADHGTAVGWRRGSIAVAAANANANADRFSPDTSVHQQVGGEGKGDGILAFHCFLEISACVWDI